jgi:hypothetical protein
MTEEDYSHFVWEKSKSKEMLIDALRKVEKNLSTVDEKTLMNHEKIKEYKENIAKIFDHGESEQTLDSYKNSVLRVLNLSK